MCHCMCTYTYNDTCIHTIHSTTVTTEQKKNKTIYTAGLNCLQAHFQWMSLPPLRLISLLPFVMLHPHPSFLLTGISGKRPVPDQCNLQHWLWMLTLAQQPFNLAQQTFNLLKRMQSISTNSSAQSHFCVQLLPFSFLHIMFQHIFNNIYISLEDYNIVTTVG